MSEGNTSEWSFGTNGKKTSSSQNTTIFKAQLRLLPSIAFMSAFLNNTPVVVIFAPIVKRWAESVKLPATKFLIPLSYVTILRTLYIDWNINKSGGRRNGARGRVSWILHVRTGKDRYLYCSCRNTLFVAFFEATAPRFTKGCI